MAEVLYRRHDIEDVTTCTYRYAHEHCNNSNFPNSPTEIRKFCGILLLSGYHEAPHISNYRSTQPDLAIPAEFNTMSRNRFHEIKRYIHFADNKNLQPGDKMARHLQCTTYSAIWYAS